MIHHQYTNAVAILAIIKAAKARTRGRDPAEVIAAGVVLFVVSVAVNLLLIISLSVGGLGSSVALTGLASVTGEVSVVEGASKEEEVLVGAVVSAEVASFDKPPVRVTAWYKRVKSAPISPFVLLIVYSVESSNPDCLETTQDSITDRLISQTLEYTVPSMVPCTSYTPVSAAPFGNVLLAQGPMFRKAVWWSHPSGPDLHPRSIYRVPVASASNTSPWMVTPLSAGQRSEVIILEGILEERLLPRVQDEMLINKRFPRVSGHDKYPAREITSVGCVGVTNRALA